MDVSVKNIMCRAGDKRLPAKYEVGSSIPGTRKKQNKKIKGTVCGPGMVAHTCNLRTWEAEAGDFKANLSHIVS